jgi:hypothetical protein
MGANPTTAFIRRALQLESPDACFKGAWHRLATALAREVDAMAHWQGDEGQLMPCDE